MQAMPGMMKNMGGQSGENKINEHMISTYAGVGSGIMTATVVLWIRFQLVLKNPKKAERNAAQQYRREKSGDWKEGIQICLHRTDHGTLSHLSDRRSVVSGLDQCRRNTYVDLPAHLCNLL